MQLHTFWGWKFVVETMYKSSCSQSVLISLVLSQLLTCIFQVHVYAHAITAEHWALTTYEKLENNPVPLSWIDMWKAVRHSECSHSLNGLWLRNISEPLVLTPTLSRVEDCEYIIRWYPKGPVAQEGKTPGNSQQAAQTQNGEYVPRPCAFFGYICFHLPREHQPCHDDNEDSEGEQEDYCIIANVYDVMDCTVDDPAPEIHRKNAQEMSHDARCCYSKKKKKKVLKKTLNGQHKHAYISTDSS